MPVYRFTNLPAYEPVSVADVEGNEAATGTTDNDGVFEATLDAGTYIATVGDNQTAGESVPQDGDVPTYASAVGGFVPQLSVGGVETSEVYGLLAYYGATVPVPQVERWYPDWDYTDEMGTAMEIDAAATGVEAGSRIKFKRTGVYVAEVNVQAKQSTGLNVDCRLAVRISNDFGYRPTETKYRAPATESQVPIDHYVTAQRIIIVPEPGVTATVEFENLAGEFQVVASAEFFVRQII